METSATPSMPTTGGSYVRNGDELQRVQHTEPAADAVATNPIAPGAAAAAPAAEAAQE